jgi:hypothetical protein
MIDFGKPKIFEGEMLEASDRALWREGAEANEVQELVEFAFFHGRGETRVLVVSGIVCGIV